MNITELIDRLTKIREENGELQIAIMDSEFGFCSEAEIVSVRKHNSLGKVRDKYSDDSVDLDRVFVLID